MDEYEGWFVNGHGDARDMETDAANQTAGKGDSCGDDGYHNGGGRGGGWLFGNDRGDSESYGLSLIAEPEITIYREDL